MKSFLKISFLLSFSFFTYYASANETLSPVIEHALLEGDTTIMQEQGVQVLTDCAGVILDPGGYGDYQNGIQSTITIEASTNSIVSLFFSEFNIENTFDDFYIHDGPSQSSPLIGNFDNMELLGQTINSTGGSITIVFVTDNSVFREGFVIDYLVAGGGGTPNASFEVSQTTPIPVNAPVEFTDLSQNAGTWLYDFDDGMQSNEQNPFHSFSEPGSYEVSLTISNCTSVDTYVQTVIVQEYGQMELNPAEICVSLNSFMTTTVQVSLTNTGEGDLYYNFTEISNENPNSLTVILGTGVIPPGGTQSVNLFFSAGELFGGTYIHDLLLQTGDADQAEIIYPVKMIVTGIPLITTSPDFVLFPTAYLGNPLLDSICINNPGTDTLHVTNITIDVPVFSVSPTQISIAPEGEGKIYFTSLANDVGIFSGLVYITSNANTTVTIPIFGEVIDPPVGVFNPDDICLNLAQDESTLFIMGISNEGGQDLDWNFAFQNTIPDWLEITTLSGSMQPGESESVPIIVNSTGLVTGVYEYTATIFNNDPILGTTNLNVKLNVVAAPITDFFPDSQNTCDGIISFIDASQGGATSWLWDFGDNTSSEEQNPTHIYQEEGIYDVSLIACNTAGCDTIFYENLINYTTDEGDCSIFSFGIVGDTILNSCTGIIYDSGGPNEDYAENSDYTITISPPNALAIHLVFDEFELESGNWDMLSIYAGEDIDAPSLGSYSGSEPPGGGELFVFSESVTLEFISDGIIELSGFAISYSCITPEAIASFASNIDEDCSNEIVFTNNSLNSTFYSWDFGDGNFSNEVSPTHIFNSPGIYEVSLTADNFSSTSTVTETVQIFNLPFELDIISPSNVYINTPIDLSYNSTTSLSQVEWSTSSGDISNSDNPDFTFTQLGEEEISLTGIDMNGCQVSTTELIFVDELSNTSDNQFFSSFKVFPNPTQAIVNIDLVLKENSQVELVLFNSFGQRLIEQKSPSTASINEQMNLNKLTNGTYYLAIWIDSSYVGRRAIILTK